VALSDLHADEASRRLTILAREGMDTLLDTARALRAAGITVADIALRQPSLDETFLALTSSGPASRPLSQPAAIPGETASASDRQPAPRGESGSPLASRASRGARK
jgi:ABC-2 type transport system ATP-binding protein